MASPRNFNGFSPSSARRSVLSRLVATMLEVRSAHLMDLAAGLPRDAERLGPVGNAEGGTSGVRGC